MRINIIPCICTPEYNSIVSIYDGMPQIKLNENMSYFEIFCPKCGRGGCGMGGTSVYKAVKEWNEMQMQLRNRENPFIIK